MNEINKELTVDDLFIDNRNIYTHIIYQYEDPGLHHHSFIEFFYVLDGQCIHFINDENIKISAGDAYLLTPNDTHRFFKIDANFLHRDIIFKEEYFKSFCNLYAPDFYEKLTNDSLIKHFKLTNQQIDHLEMLMQQINQNENVDLIAANTCSFIINALIDANLKETEVPYAIGKDFYLTSITSLSKLSASGYNMKNKKGKVIYSSEKSIELLNNYLVITTDKETSKKIIVDKKGKVLYSNISDYESYFNGKIIEIEIDNTYALLNELGEKFLSDYSISKIVKDEDEKYLYAVVKNEKDKVYNYFDLLKAKIVGDSFSSYSAGDEVGTLVITKKENEKSVKYLLTKDGKQSKLETEETITSSDGFYKDFKDKADTDTYSIFSGSLYSKDQENIIVNNKVEKSMGVYNVNTKEYKELYKYAQDKSYFYSSVYNVKNSDENGLVLRFICTTSCDQNESLVYDVKNNKELYRYEGENHITSYAEYENGYKVIGLSNSTDKYTVLDKDNKNLYSSKKVVLILDSELVLGDKPSYSAILYSSKDNKVINENTVSIIDDYKNMLYKYSDETNTYILDKDGKEIIKVNKNDYLKNIDNYYIYIANNKINIYDIDKNKTNSYTMKDSEKMNDASGSMISPYKQTLVINNSTEKYVKVINFNGKVLKKIDNVELSKFKTNDEAEKAFLIVKKTKNNKDLYGLYVYQ